jgi:hypothetical protein
MIIIPYVYKKSIIIIKHKSKYKFQMCNEHGLTNLKFNYTWQHDLLTKLGYIKSTSSKHVIFLKPCKLHHIPYVATTNYLWLSLITLIKCNPIVWRPHQCVHNMLNNFLCLSIWVIHIIKHFPKRHFCSIVHERFYIPIFTPYDIY